MHGRVNKRNIWAALICLAGVTACDEPSPAEPNVLPRTNVAATSTTLDANFQEIIFDSDVSIGPNAIVGFSHRYVNAITIGATVVDAVVTVKAIEGTPTEPRVTVDDGTSNTLLSKLFWELNGNNVTGLGSTSLDIEFFLTGSNTAVTLSNVAVHFVDVDDREYVESKSVIAARTLTGTTKITIADKGSSTVRATETTQEQAASLGDQAHWVEFRYAPISKIELQLGIERSRTQAFFYGRFKPAPWTSPTSDVTPTLTPLKVVADDKTVVFGGQAPQYSYQLKNANGDPVAAPAGLTAPICTAPYTAGTTGPGTAAIKCSGAAADGYSFTYVDATLTITSIPLRVIADDASVVFSGQAPQYSYKLKNANGDPVAAPAGLIAPSCTAPYTAGTTGVGTVAITCSGASAVGYTFTYEAGALTISKSNAGATYTGTSGVLTALPPTLLLSTAILPSACTGPVTYTIAPDPTSGTTGSRVITNGVSTAGWVPAVYEITAAYAGNENCFSAGDVGVMTIAAPGASTTGGGQYIGTTSTQSNVRVHFGHTVQSTSNTDRKTGLTTITHRGNLLWMVKEGWRFKGRILSTTVRNSSGASVSGDQEAFVVYPCPAGVGTATSQPKCGQFVGEGVLQKWEPNTSSWVTATEFGTAGSLPFTATIYDGGSVSTCKGKTCTVTDVADSFGLTLPGVSKTNGIPVGAPLEVRKQQNGSIHIR